MKPDQLLTFCSHTTGLPRINKPFTHGRFSYATDNKIIVRVPALKEVPYRADSPDARDVESIFGARVVGGGITLQPIPKKQPCHHCIGEGYCWCAECRKRNTLLSECRFCWGGNGSVLFNRVVVGNATFSDNQLRRIECLPRLVIWSNANRMRPALFTFTGGMGAIMPLNS
jgi:hypothetical protein